MTDIEERQLRWYLDAARRRFIPPPDGRFTVRLWNGSDGVWCDVVTNVDRATALATWCERTHNGTKHTSFADFDYYDIFPATTRMTFSGAHTMRGED